MSTVVTAPKTRITGIDSLRAAAAFAVFVCHVSSYWVTDPALPKLLRDGASNGAYGVDLFIVISGTCLMLPVVAVRSVGPWSTFWKRRALRLLPPYYVALAFAAVFAMLAATAKYVVGPQAGLDDVLLHVLLLQTVVPDRIAAINGSFWSIALEAHLYLVFPFVVVLARRFGITFVLAATAIVNLLWTATADLGLPAPFGDDHVMPARLVQFVAGMWCAEKLVKGHTIPRSTLWLAAGVGLVGTVVATSMELTYGAALIRTVPSVAMVLLIAGLDESRGLARRTAWFGAISYSFYLLHQPLLLLSAPLVRRITVEPVVLGAIGITIGFALACVPAILLHRFVEVPSQQLARRVARPKPSPGAEAQLV